MSIGVERGSRVLSGAGLVASIEQNGTASVRAPPRITPEVQHANVLQCLLLFFGCSPTWRCVKSVLVAEGGRRGGHIILCSMTGIPNVGTRCLPCATYVRRTLYDGNCWNHVGRDLTVGYGTQEVRGEEAVRPNDLLAERTRE